MVILLVVLMVVFLHLSLRSVLLERDQADPADIAVAVQLHPSSSLVGETYPFQGFADQEGVEVQVFPEPALELVHVRCTHVKPVDSGIAEVVSALGPADPACLASASAFAVVAVAACPLGLA